MCIGDATDDVFCRPMLLAAVAGAGQRPPVRQPRAPSERDRATAAQRLLPRPLPRGFVPVRRPLTGSTSARRPPTEQPLPRGHRPTSEAPPVERERPCLSCTGQGAALESSTACQCLCMLMRPQPVGPHLHPSPSQSLYIFDSSFESIPLPCLVQSSQNMWRCKAPLLSYDGQEDPIKKLADCVKDIVSNIGGQSVG